MCGITYGPGTNALSALGASETSAGHAVLLLSLFPPLAAVLASVFLRERLTVLRVHCNRNRRGRRSDTDALEVGRWIKFSR